MGDQDRSRPRDGHDVPPSDSAVIDFLRLLNNVSDGASVARALAQGLLAPWSPDQLAVYVVEPDGLGLGVAASFGFTPEQRSEYSHVPLGVRVPLTEVFRTGEERSWRMAEAAAAFPAVRGWTADHPVPHGAEVLGLPIRAAGGVIGALLVTFPDGVDGSWRLRSRLDAAVSAIGLWVRAVDTIAPSGSARSRTGRGVRITDRQRRLLAQLGDGATNAQIATELGVSVGTVKADLARLFRLLGVSSRDELPASALRAGLLTR